MKTQHLDSDRELTEREIADALAMPSDFGYRGDNEELFETWSLGPIIETRDSDLLTRANRVALMRYLESDPSLADDYSIVGASHWACGWVDHLSFRVLDSEGKQTRIARVLAQWFDGLRDYPVADESLWSEMEFEEFSRFFDSAMDEAQDRLEVVFTDPARAALFDRCFDDMREGGRDGFVTDDDIVDAARLLGFLPDEMEE